MISAVLMLEGHEPAVWDMPKLQQKKKTREEIKSRHWVCKFCGKDMNPCMGPLREWHFAHKRDASACPFDTESEKETPQHLALKRAAGEAMFRHFGTDAQHLEYEVRFETIGRIADALITLKDGSRVAVEEQISPLSVEHLQERTNAYLREDIEVVWVFLEQPSGGLKQGGLWDTCRAWLLNEGYLVLTARATTIEKTVPLPNLPQ